MTAYTVVLVAVLLRRYHRAAFFTAGVMIVTPLLTTLFKVVVGRDRPSWQNPDDLLHSNAFPSGHACYVVTLVACATMLVRAGVHWAATTAAITVAVVIVAVVVIAITVLPVVIAARIVLFVTIAVAIVITPIVLPRRRRWPVPRTPRALGGRQRRLSCQRAKSSDCN